MEKIYIVGLRSAIKEGSAACQPAGQTKNTEYNEHVANQLAESKHKRLNLKQNLQQRL